MSEHTAGPWCWIGGEDDAPINVLTWENGQTYCFNPVLVAGDVKVIEAGDCGEYDAVENPHDKLLIAAAPDLLAALIEARRIIAGYIGLPVEQCTGGEFGQINDAIAKAQERKP